MPEGEFLSRIGSTEFLKVSLYNQSIMFIMLTSDLHKMM